MLPRFAFTVAVTCAALSTFAIAQAQFGTAAEAKAMLEKAVVAVTADKAKALDQMQKGEGGFKDRDLYAFCANASDGIITAHPALKGKNIRDIKDKDGKALGEEMMKVATEGKVQEVSYMWPRPGADTTPVQKVSFVTKAGDQVCGVGYYK
jgi:signal transduction histidine kinase